MVFILLFIAFSIILLVFFPSAYFCIFLSESVLLLFPLFYFSPGTDSHYQHTIFYLHILSYLALPPPDIRLILITFFYHSLHSLVFSFLFSSLCLTSPVIAFLPL